MMWFYLGFGFLCGIVFTLAVLLVASMIKIVKLHDNWLKEHDDLRKGGE